MPQTAPTELSLAAAFARLAGIGAAVGVAVALIGFMPTRSTAGEAGVAAMLIGIAVSVVGAWPGLAVMLQALRVSPVEQVNRILGGLGVRFAVTVALAVAVAFSGLPAAKTAVFWVALAQLAVLAADTSYFVHLLKRYGRHHL
jgi:hypothetical protein